MARISYVQINGVLYDKSKPFPEEVAVPRTAGFIPDIPDFVSPIDGSVVHGRAGMREHCKRYDVVPTNELKGLPPKPAVAQYIPDRAAIREQLKRQFYK